jgi:hypothetical protein
MVEHVEGKPLGPRTYAYTVPPSAVFFRDKKNLASRGFREAEANGALMWATLGDAATLEGQPAGFTLRSSSRSIKI